MPTFKKVEVVDARQFTGGVDQGMQLVMWIEGYGYEGWWSEENKEIRWEEQIRVGPKNSRKRSAYIGDWIVHHQDGEFSVMRPQELKEQYEQV